MINLNSPIKLSLMISEGRQTVSEKYPSYLPQTPIWGQWLNVQEHVSPINSLQANETPKETNSSTPPVPYVGELKVCKD